MDLQKKDIISALEHGRISLINLVESISEEDLQKDSVCEGWNNKAVLGHVIGFELSRIDLLKLVFRARQLDEINNDQSNRYLDRSKADLIELLKKGHRRNVRTVYLTPNFILNKKLLPVPNGKLSIAQLFGDIVMDRAIHQIDISHPLKRGSVIDDDEVMFVSIRFILQCVDLFNTHLAKKYHGEFIVMKLSGLGGGTYCWEVGTGNVGEGEDQNPIITVECDTNDFLFTLTGRDSLVQGDVVIRGDNVLEEKFRSLLNENALWESR